MWELSEDGSAQFVYTPYENKTGKDSFTYVAIDSAGNTSPEAKVTIQIDKPDTKVDYADLDGSPAHKAALRLAEEGIFVGEYRNGQYFFDPDQTVSRAEFLSLAMGNCRSGAHGGCDGHRLLRRRGHPHLGQGLYLLRPVGGGDPGLQRRQRAPPSLGRRKPSPRGRPL